MGGTMVAIVVETALWWGLMAGLWNATPPSASPQGAIVSGAAGLVAAVTATLTRRAFHVGGRLNARWALWLPTFVAAIVADTVRVFALALRRAPGREAPTEFRTAWLERTGPSQAMLHRALATLTISSTPGSIVFDTDDTEHSLRKHTLVSGPPDLQKTVSR